MSRPTTHRTARHGAIGAALLEAMDRDLAELRSSLDLLAAQVESRRAAGLDVAEDGARLAELVATVGRMAAEADRLAAGGSR